MSLPESVAHQCMIALFVAKANLDGRFAKPGSQRGGDSSLIVRDAIVECVAVHYDCDATNFQCAHAALPKVYLNKEPLLSLSV